jgi:hypothetical protein
LSTDDLDTDLARGRSRSISSCVVSQSLVARAHRFSSSLSALTCIARRPERQFGAGLAGGFAPGGAML